MKFRWKKKDYYIDGYLSQVLVSLVYNIKNDWDFVILITGDRTVRVGKSVLAQTVCAFLALTMQKFGLKSDFTDKDIYFDNRKMIEESIRIAIDHSVDIRFCPTEDAVDNLVKEQKQMGTVNVGDIMYDLAKHWEPNLERLVDEEYLYMTIHRATNADSFVKIEEILRNVGNSGITTIFAVHPRTKQTMDNYKSLYIPSNIKIIEMTQIPED